jgi:hypothetical protein
MHEQGNLSPLNMLEIRDLDEKIMRKVLTPTYQRQWSDDMAMSSTV